MPDPVGSTVATVAATKSSVKLFAFAAGVAGSALMVAIRPNLSRKMLALHMAVAGCMSYLLHGIAVHVLKTWLDVDKWPHDDVINLHVSVAFIIGALSWGFVGGLYWFREKFGTNPIEAIAAIRNLRSGGTSVIGANPVPKALGPANRLPPDTEPTGNAGKYD